MNWRNFAAPIVGVFLVVAGAGTYSVLAPTAPMAALVDGGISADCTPRLITCPIHASDEAAARLADAGAVFDRAAMRYLRVTTLAYQCPATSELLIPALSVFGVQVSGDPHLQVVDRDLCTLSACDAFCASPKPWRVEHAALPCVRRPLDGGECWRTDFAGGWRDFGIGTVFPAGEADGGACEPVAAGCGEDGNGVTGGHEGEL